MARKRDTRPLIFAAIAAALFLLKPRIFKGAPRMAAAEEHHVSVERREPVRGKKRYIAGTLFIVLTLVSGVAGWLLFSAARSGLPIRPSFQSGGILVFVDHPNEKADIIVNFDRSGAFSVSVLSPAGGEFLVVTSGSATAYAAGTRATDASAFVRGPRITAVEDKGCSDNGEPCIAYAGEDAAADFATIEHDLYHLNGYSTAMVTVAAGEVDYGNTDSGGLLTVYGNLSSAIVASSGSTDLGQLPTIGVSDSLSMASGGVSGQTSLGYVTFSNDILYAYPTLAGSILKSAKWYAPDATVHVSVMYSGSVLAVPWQTGASGSLPPNYALLSADPPTEASGALRWQGSQALEPSWNLSDSSAQESHNAQLFLSGILLGAAVSFLGIAIDRFITPS